MTQPLAPAGRQLRTPFPTNQSRLISLTLFDTAGEEIRLQMDEETPIEMTIPRDPTRPMPPLHLENVTFVSQTAHSLLFNLHFVNLTFAYPVSLHVHMAPIDPSLAYLLIHKFDRAPQLNSSHRDIDGWMYLCPSCKKSTSSLNLMRFAVLALTTDGFFTFALDHRETQSRQSVIFGLRQLTHNEANTACSPTLTNTPSVLVTTDQPFNFTANYFLRIFSSGCYFIDAEQRWQTTGMKVSRETNIDSHPHTLQIQMGPRTDLNQTHCYSTHLTSFAGGFIVLPKPVNWNYVFANADFTRNMTIYLTVICVTALFLLLLIYARYKDRKDVEKVSVVSLP
jgi:hypothetical protein